MVRRERKTISKNRTARHEYFIDETFEAGLELTGTEVRSLRERACQITDTFCLVRNREAWLVGPNFARTRHDGCRTFPDVEAVKQALAAEPVAGRLILIKGSNGTRLFELPALL